MRVPLDRADPRSGTTEVAYALVRRARTDRTAAGTIAVNPGGPGGAAIPLAAQFAGWLGDLTDDHDVLLMDPRGTGASGYLDCGVRPDLLTLPRPERVEEMGRCGASIADRIRFYTTAAAADDLDAIRAHLGIARLGLYGLSYGTNLMTTYAVRHPDRVEAMVLSGPAPRDRDPLKGSNARATRDAVRLVCERSGGACDPDRTLTDLGRLARRLRRHPIRYPVTVNGEERTAVLDEAALVTTVVPHTDAPVLVLSGDLDINTPPEDGHRTAAQFANATHLVVPNAGHVPTFETTGCTTRLTEDFFRSHRTGDTSCLRQIPPIAVPEEGPGGEARAVGASTEAG